MAHTRTPYSVTRGICSNPRAIPPSLCRPYVVIYRTDPTSRELDAQCVERPVPCRTWTRPSRDRKVLRWLLVPLPLGDRPFCLPEPSRLANHSPRGVRRDLAVPSTTAKAAVLSGLTLRQQPVPDALASEPSLLAEGHPSPVGSASLEFSWLVG